MWNYRIVIKHISLIYDDDNNNKILFMIFMTNIEKVIIKREIK